MMDIQDKLKLLSKKSLIDIILWTLKDLFNWSRNGSIEPIARYAAMMDEAVRYQIDKAYKVKSIDDTMHVSREEEE